IKNLSNTGSLSNSPRFTCIVLSLCLFAWAVSVAESHADDVVLIGSFVSTAQIEPMIFGESDCWKTNKQYCAGSAVAAVSIEFKTKESPLVKDLARNLVASVPFLKSTVNFGSAYEPKELSTASLRVTVPIQMKNLELPTVVSMKPENSSGFDLTIPVNVTEPAMTASLRKDETVKPTFTFQKSYAFLK
ncbi:MAG: hypothetical protein ACPGVN_00185, partial [Alphaproteobacteria bacterium]